VRSRLENISLTGCRNDIPAMAPATSAALQFMVNIWQNRTERDCSASPKLNRHEHSHTAGNACPVGGKPRCGRLRDEPRQTGRRSGKVSASGRIGGAILNGLKA